jgi:anti-anti-sigma regulatory factor
VTRDQLPPLVLVCDVSSLADADEEILNALAGLQLAARRCGASIHFVNASRRLRDLLELVGLGDVFACSGALGSDVQVRRHTEQREQLGVDEIVDPGDAAV